MVAEAGLTDAELAHALSYYSDPASWWAAEQERRAAELERRAAENALIVAQMDDDDGDDEDDIAAIMEDCLAANLQGSKRPSGVHAQISDAPTQPGTKSLAKMGGIVQPRAWRHMSGDTIVARDAVRDGSIGTVFSTQDASDYGARGSREGEEGHKGRLLAVEDWDSLDAEAIQKAALDRLDVTPEEWKLAQSPHQHNPGVLAAKVKVNGAMVDLLDSTGDAVAGSAGRGTSYLAKALGMTHSNLRKRLANERKRRAELVAAEAA